MSIQMIDKTDIVEAISSFYRREIYRFPENGIPCMDEPRVRVAAADDPLFDILAEDDAHPLMKPAAGFALTFGESAPAASVISWIIPVTEYSRTSNSAQTGEPSREWTLSRHHGELFNNGLRAFMTEYLSSRGFRAVAGQNADWWKRFPDGVSSNWSERHAAYAAGHGTFSLCGGLITEKGIAVRIGSIITDCPLEPDARPASGIFDHCLNFRNGTCGVCIKRCPAGAITREGLDRMKCKAVLFGEKSKSLAEKHGGALTAGCGLCQTGVPCENRIPESKNPAQ